jgi:hypothetical protein
MIPIIKPMGVGDLKIVKLKLARYEPGEVAHIENIMARESKSRKHRRLREIEEIQFIEQERLEESIHDLQSTERFELQNESQKTIRSETSFQAGVNLSVGYGPFSLGAYANYNTSDSKEESDTNSMKYAKDITEKTMSRLVEKVRQERRTRTLEQFEETNEHGFDNREGTKHIAGIYRWVDKYYRAKVLDYGRRLMYEFVVPEPASFFLFATKFNLDTKVLPLKPDPLTVPGSSKNLSPDDITRHNYMTLVANYNVRDVQPPPPEWLTVSKAVHREITNAGPWAFSEDLKLPKGYRAEYGYYVFDYTWNTGFAGSILVGNNKITFGKYPGLIFIQQEESMPLSGTGFSIRTFAINIHVACSLDSSHYEKWKIDTYTAIMNAYSKALMDYEERVAAAQISQGVAIGGENPAINREIEKRELKRACIIMWTHNSLNYPQGIDHTPLAVPPNNYPEINFKNAVNNAGQIEFIEKAFDWKNMTYEFAPYFWGRKSNWIDILTLQHKDPVFESFLQAGAARVVVPVNPLYSEAVLYYQLTGVIWTGGTIAPFDETIYPDAELYNSYINELEESQTIPDIDQEPEIDPDDESTWLIKVPTTLVWLQSDNKLPDVEAVS